MLEIQVSCYPWVLFLYWLFGLSLSDRVSLTLIYLKLTEPSASDFTVVGLKVGEKVSRNRNRPEPKMEHLPSPPSLDLTVGNMAPART